MPLVDLFFRGPVPVECSGFCPVHACTEYQGGYQKSCPATKFLNAVCRIEGPTSDKSSYTCCLTPGAAYKVRNPGDAVFQGARNCVYLCWSEDAKLPHNHRERHQQESLEDQQHTPC